MPGTHCARPVRQRALLPKGCAMISRSAGRRARLLLPLRVATRSTPMIGADRSSLSCRSVLFLLVLLGTPMAAHSDTLADSAKELARKIAANLPSAEGVAFEVRNISSATPEELTGVGQSLQAELESLKVRIVTAGTAAIDLRITLAENMKGFLFTAEFTRGDASQVILMAVPRTSESKFASHSMPIALQSEKIWEGPQQILDAAITFSADGKKRLVLLLADGLEIQDTQGRIMTSIKFPLAGSATRDPLGLLGILGNVAWATFPFRDCTVSLETFQLTECHTIVQTDFRVGDMGPVYEVPLNLSTPGRVSEPFMPGDACGAGLTTSSGDNTQPDWVQALSSEPPGIAISNRVDFPGPVLALRGGPGELRAIVRNLKTGNYEAYSLSCGK